MAWQTPKQDWKAGDVPAATDFNRIEGNVQELQNTKETPAGAQAKADAAESAAKSYADGVAAGEAGAVQAELDAHQAESASTTAKGHVQLNNTVTSTSTTQAATASAVKTAYDKGNHSHPYAASSHVGSTGSAHGVATTSVSGFMSALDKIKLDGIDTAIASGSYEGNAEVEDHTERAINVGFKPKLTIVARYNGVDDAFYIPGVVFKTQSSTGTKIAADKFHSKGFYVKNNMYGGNKGNLNYTNATYYWLAMK